LWSETYDRDLKDVFTVQDEIASAVVQALQIKLSGGELSRQKGGTQNLEAYLLGLRAEGAVIQNTPSSLDAASEYLDQAIKLDPNYAWAWSRLATITLLKTTNTSLAAAEGYERARQLARHALQLSPDFVDAHVRLAFLNLYEWDWAAAEIEGQRALEIDPTNDQALFFAGNLSYALGRWNEAERQFSRARIRDPLNSYFIYGLGGLYCKTGRFAEAEAMYRRLLELAPGFVPARGKFGQALLADGNPEGALAMAQQSVGGLYGEGGEQLFVPIALQANGRQSEADALLKAEIPRWADRGAYFVAMNYAYRGDRDLALQWLERAYEQREPALSYIVGEPLFKNLADDPRYKVFLRKMKLPE
jgi:tetratricopeptide (TPR) repeat protein